MTTSEFEPSLTYGGTSGNVNVDTSRDATIHADLSGITNKAQKYALIVADWAREKGVTVAELRERNGSVHHGRISAALTNLHRDGRLVALRERRGHCGIYVLPEYVNGRETRQYKPNRKPIDPEVIRGVLLHHGEGRQHPLGFWCECGWEPTMRQPSLYLHIAQEIAEALR